MARPNVFEWATDANFSTGDAAGNPTKLEPASPGQAFVPGVPIAAEHVNWHFYALAAYLAEEVPLMNWSPRVSVSSSAATCILWTTSLYGGIWVVLGVNGSLDYSTTGADPWSTDDSGDANHDWTAGFADDNAANDTYGWVFACSPTSTADDTLAVWNGADYTDSFSFSASDVEDRAHNGIAFDDKIIILGHYDSGSGGLAAGKVLLSTASHDDMATWTRTTTDTTIASPTVFRIAKKTNTRLIALVSNATTIDSFKSGNGTSWTHTADITGATNAELADVIYDARSNRWLMLTKASGIWFATPGSEGSTWTLLCADPAATVGIGSGCWKIRSIGSRLVVTSLNTATLFVSDDDGATWEYIYLDYSQLLDLAYSPERRQWVILDVTGTQRSLAL